MNKLKNIFWITVGIAIIGFFLFRVISNTYTDYTLDNNAVLTKAIIIDDKNYMGNQPVKPEFSYSYQFIINGKSYIGNAHDNSLLVGDTIEVQYDKNNPSMNRPLLPKD